MTVMGSEHEVQTSRVFARTADRSATSPVGADPEGAEAQVQRLRSLLGRSIRMIELQNARLRDHGLQPVTPRELDPVGDDETIDLTRIRSTS